MMRRALSLIAALSAAQAFAGTTNWTGSAGNWLWSDPGNWSAGVPTTDDTANVLSPLSTIQLSGTQPVGTLNVTGIFELAGGSIAPKSIINDTSLITTLRATVVASPLLTLRGSGTSLTIDGPIQGSSFRVATSGQVNLFGRVDTDQALDVQGTTALNGNGELPLVETVNLAGELRINNSNLPRSNRINPNVHVTTSGLDPATLFYSGGTATDLYERVQELRVAGGSLSLILSSVGRPVRLESSSLNIDSDALLVSNVNGTTTRLVVDNAPPLVGGNAGTERGVMRNCFGVSGLTGSSYAAASLLTYDSALSSDARPVGLRPIRDDEYLSGFTGATPATNVRLVDAYTVDSPRSVNCLRLDRAAQLTLQNDLTITSGVIWNSARGGGAASPHVTGNGSIRSASELQVICNQLVSDNPTLDLQTELDAPGLAILGGGTVRLSGNNNLPGGVRVNSAALVTIAKPQALGDGPLDARFTLLAFEGNQTIENDLRFRSVQIQVAAGQTLTFNGHLSGRATIAPAAGYLRFNGGGAFEGTFGNGFTSPASSGEIELNGVWTTPATDRPIPGYRNIFGNATIPMLFRWGLLSPGAPNEVGMMHIYGLDTGSVVPNQPRLLRLDIDRLAADMLIVDHVSPVPRQPFTLSLNLLDTPTLHTFTIVRVDEASERLPAFAALPEGSQIVVGGSIFRISYVGGDGNDVTLTVLPEPAGLAMLGVIGILCRRANTDRRRGFVNSRT